MASGRETLKVAPRAEFGSRSSRRLRREGLVPGVVYGGGSEARSFQAGEREIRAVLAGGQALFDLELEGSSAVPVVVKEQQLHPVRGNLEHIDLQEVKLDEEIQAEVAIELEGAEVAPGVKEGGVLEHVTREVTVEALPTEIPERIVADVSEMEINDTLQLSALTIPGGVKLVADEPEEITIATLSPPRVEEEPEPEVEEEAELVGEEGEAPPRRRARPRPRARATRATPARSSRNRPVSPPGGLLRRANPDRRPRQPRQRYAGTRHNVGFEVGAELSRRWDLPRAKSRFGGQIAEGRAGPGRAAGRDPAAADLHERLRRLGRAGARLAQGPARPGRRPPR